VSTTVSPAVNLTLEAEILKCADTGRLELVITTNDRAYETGSADQLRADIADARAQLDRMEQLAARYEAIESLQTLLDRYDGRILRTAAEESGGCSWYGFVDGRLVVLAPKGQDPVTTLELIGGYLTRMDGAA